MNYDLILKNFLFGLSMFVILFLTLCSLIIITRNVFPMFSNENNISFVVCSILGIGTLMGSLGLFIYEKKEMERKYG